MKLPKFIRNILAAFAFATPNFSRGKETVNDQPVEPVGDSKHKFAPGGALESVDKHYGRTIAGGPGSQRIGDTFDALPEAERQRMLDARKGRIRKATGLDDVGAGSEGTSSMSGTDKIARALASGRYNRKPGADDLGKAVKAARKEATGSEEPPTPFRGFA